MKIKTKFRWATIISVIIATGVSWIFFLTSRQQNRAIENSRVAYEIVKGVFDLNILTNDYLLHYGQRAQSQWGLKYDSLATLLRGEEFQRPEERIILGQMRQNHARMKSIFSQLVANREKRNRAREGTAISVALEERLVAQLLVKSQALVSSASRLAELSQGQVVVAQRKVHLLIMALPVVIAVVMVTATLFISRSVVAPISRLHKGTKIIGTGQLDHRIGIVTKDEIGQLSRAFNQMGEKLKAITVSRNELAKEIAERVRAEAQLQEAKDAAEYANRAKSEFLANMSHELRTPLNAIIGFAEILRDEIVGTINDEQKELIHDIHASGGDLLSMINDILDLSKIEAGRMVLQLEIFPLEEAMSQVNVIIKAIADKKRIQLSLECDSNISIEADKGKFKQILYNLLSNAVKFTPEGGKVTTKLNVVENELIVRVIDTGVGISTEDQAKLFQPFTQLDASNSREYGGTGLGLALTRRFVELHGGRIWVESERGKGSTFLFALPLRQHTSTS